MWLEEVIKDLTKQERKKIKGTKEKTLKMKGGYFKGCHVIYH